MLSGGSGVLASELSGDEEATLAGGEERSESETSAMVEEATRRRDAWEGEEGAERGAGASKQALLKARRQ